jgi:anti-sigma-K factor RskA
VAALALLVAALIRRPPPDFATRRVVAVIAGAANRPAWAIRLAPASHLIEVLPLQPPSPPPGRVYQLWLSTKDTKSPQQLGLLPQTKTETIPVTPENAHRLGGDGELVVTLEPDGGSTQPEPSGPVRFRGGLDGGRP